MRKKSPSPVDAHVGRRVRLRRMMIGMSQEKLGDALGVTFQQVQKYERGANRVGAGRLQQIASALSVPVSFFFEEQPAGVATNLPPDATVGPDVVSQFLATRDGLALAIAFQGIGGSETRMLIVHMVEKIAELSKPGTLSRISGRAVA